MSQLIASLTPWQWSLIIVGAFVIGVSKAGFAGLGLLSVVAFALALEARQSVGFVLPLLLAADIVAVSYFWRDAQWKQIARLMLPTLTGLFLGDLLSDYIHEEHFAVVIGVISLAMLALQFLRWKRPEKFAQVPHSWWFAWSMGIIAGMATMMANAAGPVMTLYLLSMGLPKNQFVGTGAVFFFLINIIKVPFFLVNGQITQDSLGLNLLLVPAVWLGVFLGKRILQLFNQHRFEAFVIALTAIGAIELCFGFVRRLLE